MGRPSQTKSACPGVRMAKPEWGAKRSCPSCGTRFYDLMRDPVPCPSCGTTFELASLTERKSSQPARARAKPERAAPAAAASSIDDDDVIDDDSDNDNDVDDAVLIEEDDDDDDDLGEIGVGDGDKEDES